MADSYDLSDKTAVVTGGARGIGRAIAERLLASGSRVWVWDVVAAFDMSGGRPDTDSPLTSVRALRIRFRALARTSPAFGYIRD
jgi:NAD(P)-dependent dehydrogenase (short-subunit alcohol dehydrogenase family)